MKKILFFCAFVVFCGFSVAEEELLDPYVNWSISQLIQHYNYTLSEHDVITKDGYILTMFRLYNATAYNPKLLPIIMFHGLSGCTNNWFLKGKASLPFVLADLGYDLWMPNARGTVYSKRHIKLNPKSPSFWRFSWHEIGVYDMPASIDMVLKDTGHQKVTVLAHSEGCCYFFAMAADLPEYDKKVALSIHMAPGVIFKNPTIKYWSGLASFFPLFEGIGNALQYNSLTYENVNKALALTCKDKMLSVICKEFYMTVFEDREELEPKNFAFYASKIPCGGGLQEGLHYAQSFSTGEFRHYDYGSQKNLRVYNSTKPPPYNLSNVKSKVILMYGAHDYLSSVEDCKLLASKLPNVIQMAPTNTHMNFLVGKHAYDQVYIKIISYLKRINRMVIKTKGSP